MEVLSHIDFAENNVLRYAAATQSMHFGGAHDEATLHTGVAYVNNVALSATRWSTF